LPLVFDIGRDAGGAKAQRRIAHSQANLRRLNEAMRATARGHIAFRCECGRLGCNELVALSRDEYESVRAHARRFAIVPGHEVTDVDAPVERHARYVVVEACVPAAADVADRTDPRVFRG
jgi:hypothetical protein